ncbi:MAG: EamA family transporter [Halobacteria archaeon]
MSYLAWAVAALVLYTLVPPLVKLTTRDAPTDVVAFATNLVLVVAAFALVVYNGHSVTEHLTGRTGMFMLLAGIGLAGGILTYYHALSLGPVSVVTPIFGLFLVTSSVAGVVFLDESVNYSKIAAVILALAAIYLAQR